MARKLIVLTLVLGVGLAVTGVAGLLLLRMFHGFADSPVARRRHPFGIRARNLTRTRRLAVSSLLR